MEFISLNALLDDKIVCIRLKQHHPATLNRMIERYTELVDEIVQQYELPNLIKNPVKD